MQLLKVKTWSIVPMTLQHYFGRMAKLFGHTGRAQKVVPQGT